MAAIALRVMSSRALTLRARWLRAARQPMPRRADSVYAMLLRDSLRRVLRLTPRCYVTVAYMAYAAAIRHEMSASSACRASAAYKRR